MPNPCALSNEEQLKEKKKKKKKLQLYRQTCLDRLEAQIEFTNFKQQTKSSHSLTATNIVSI